MFICPLPNLIKKKTELFYFIPNVALILSKTCCMQASRVKKNYFL